MVRRRRASSNDIISMKHMVSCRISNVKHMGLCTAIILVDDTRSNDIISMKHMVSCRITNVKHVGLCMSCLHHARRWAPIHRPVCFVSFTKGSCLLWQCIAWSYTQETKPAKTCQQEAFVIAFDSWGSRYDYGAGSLLPTSTTDQNS